MFAHDGSRGGFLSGLSESEVEAHGWGLNGNAGTDPATHFLGTTDAKDLVLKRNGAEIVRLGAATAASGEQAIVKLSGAVNQSGTAGYIGCLVDVTETALGSGTRWLYRADVGGITHWGVAKRGASLTTLVIQHDTSGSGPASNGLMLELNSNVASIWNREAGYLSLGANNAERVRINGATLGTAVDVRGSFGAEVEAVKTGAYTADDTDFFIPCDASGGAFIVTLPAAAGAARRIYVIKKVDASGNAVTVDGNGAETIDGAATRALAAQYDSMAIISDGSNWHRLLLS